MNYKQNQTFIMFLLFCLQTNSNPCLKTIKAHTESIDGMCLTHDTETIITAARDSLIKTWDVKTGIHLQTLQGHNDWIYTVCTSTNDKTIFSGSDSCIKIWDLYSGSCIGTLTKHKGPIYCLCTSPDDEHLYSGNGQGTIMEWDIQEGYAIRTFNGHRGAIRSLTITDDSSRLISTGEDRQLKI